MCAACRAWRGAQEAPRRAAGGGAAGGPSAAPTGHKRSFTAVASLGCTMAAAAKGARCGSNISFPSLPRLIMKRYQQCSPIHAQHKVKLPKQVMRVPRILDWGRTRRLLRRRRRGGVAWHGATWGAWWRRCLPDYRRSPAPSVNPPAELTPPPAQPQQVHSRRQRPPACSQMKGWGWCSFPKFSGSCSSNVAAPDMEGTCASLQVHQHTGRSETVKRLVTARARHVHLNCLPRLVQPEARPSPLPG